MKTIVSIYGPTSVGKTTTVKELEKRIGTEKCTRISLDKYLKTKNASIDRLAFLNSDPVDWDLVESQISMPAGSLVKRPKYDHDTYTRTGIDEEYSCTIQELILIDGAWPYHKADFKIQLNLDPNIRFRRLILRYFNEWNKKGDVWVKFATENWDQLPGVYPGIKADLTLDTSNALDKNISKILSHINYC